MPQKMQHSITSCCYLSQSKSEKVMTLMQCMKL